MALRVWLPQFPCRVCLSNVRYGFGSQMFHVEFASRMFAVSSHHTVDGSGLRPWSHVGPLHQASAFLRLKLVGCLRAAVEFGSRIVHVGFGSRTFHMCDRRRRSLPESLFNCAVGIVARACFLAAAGGDPREFTRKDTLSNPLLCRIDVSCARFSVRPHPLVRCQNLCHLRPTLVTPRPTQLPAQVSAVNLPSPSSNSSCDYSLNFCMFVSMCWSVLYELSMHKLVGCLQAPVTFRS